jgi:thioesterase domain-containing protein
LDGGVYHDSDFFALGGHSMLAIEVSLAIERHFGRALPLTQWFTTPTLGEMASALQLPAASQHDDFDGPLGRALVPIRKGDATEPLLLWIPAVGGTTLGLRRFASALPTGIEMMGFEAPPHRGLPEPDSFSAMAAAYADDVRGLVRAGIVGRHRPFVLGGNSFGAMLAHEVGCALFDDCRPAEVILVDPVVIPPRVRVRVETRGTRVEHWIRGRLRAVARRPTPRPLLIEQVTRMSNRLRRAHEPRPYPGSIVLMTTEARRRLLNDDFVQMRPLVLGDIALHPLPGEHGTFLSDERAELIAAIVGDVVKNLRRRLPSDKR